MIEIHGLRPKGDAAEAGDRMDPRFAKLVDQLAPKLERLLAAPPSNAGSFRATCRMRASTSLAKTVGICTSEDQTIFAVDMVAVAARAQPGGRRPSPFQLAREETGNLVASYRSGNMSRAGLMQRSAFVNAFEATKERIRDMEYRFVEETDQNRQALLEIYRAVVLCTPFNDFGTH